MSNLKKSLIKKMDVEPSAKFDTAFFEKLEREKARPKIFSKWVTWAVSGFAMSSVLFIAITNYNQTPKHSFNHAEYIESVAEIQSSFDDDLTETAPNDLTTVPSDEI